MAEEALLIIIVGVVVSLINNRSPVSDCKYHSYRTSGPFSVLAVSEIASPPQTKLASAETAVFSAPFTCIYLFPEIDHEVGEGGGRITIETLAQRYIIFFPERN